jgi:hypothetical protein
LCWISRGDHAKPALIYWNAQFFDLAFHQKDVMSKHDAGGRCRMLLPDCHLMFVYDAGSDIGAERPQALAFIALEFFDRRELFLVTRESGMTFPNRGFGTLAMLPCGAPARSNDYDLLSSR